jgi:hypothetical protein
MQFFLLFLWNRVEELGGINFRLQNSLFSVPTQSMSRFCAQSCILPGMWTASFWRQYCTPWACGTACSRYYIATLLAHGEQSQALYIFPADLLVFRRWTLRKYSYATYLFSCTIRTGIKELHTCICTDIVHNLIGKGKMTHIIIYTLFIKCRSSSQYS